jgi:hypothetical protein
MQYQLTIAQLEEILYRAKKQIANNSDCSRTVEIKVNTSCYTRLGGDSITACVKSKCAEDDSIEIY